MRLAIITGGSRGLGAALCELYRERGWEVIEFSRSAPHPYSVKLDLSDPLAASDAFVRELDSLGATDVEEVVAVGNAAVLGPVGPVDRLSAEDVVQHINVNVISAIRFAAAFVDAFQGHNCPKTFVNITSGAASTAYAGWSLYCASKAALESHVRAIALEQARCDQPVNAISINPGVMDTAMQEQVRNSDAEDFPAVEKYARLHEEGRLRSPSTVARQIAAMVASRPQPGVVYRVE